MSIVHTTRFAARLYLAQAAPVPGSATVASLWLLVLALVAALVAIAVLYRRLARLPERALHQDAELQEILDALPAFVFYKDRANNLLRVNRPMCEALKRDRSELEGHNCAEIFPDEADSYWDADREVIASGEAKRGIVEPMLTETGKVWVRTDKIPLRTAGGATCGLIGFSVDVTEEINSAASLEDQVSRNEALISALGEIVYERDIEADTIEWYGEVEAALGLTGAAAGLTPSEWLERVHPDERARVAARVNAAIEDRTSFNVEYRLRHADGHYLWISDRGVSRERPGTGRRTLIGVMEDVGYRKHYEGMITAYTDKLEQSNRELQQFAHVASHDLQEPLRKIIAFGDLLKARAGKELNDDVRMCVDRMQTSALRMRGFIEDLLQYSRVQSRRRPPERVDLNETMKAIEAALELQIAESGAILDVDTLDAVRADPLQVHQLLQNLVSNALKYGATDRSPVIALRTRPHGDHMTELTVADNGIGFEAKFADRIFEPFQRLHSRSEYEGTGMGLAICRRIAEGHGGSITVTSKKGEGTTFTVDLPSG